MIERLTDTNPLDVVVTDPKTGRLSGLPKTLLRAVDALKRARVNYCLIGATALAARGLPRMTRDLDFVVLVDDADAVLLAFRKAGLRQTTPGPSADEQESMVLFVDPATKIEIDLLLAAGDPEATVIREAKGGRVFGVRARIASLEHLLLMYLYSNQPRHLGDFASIVQSGRADLKKTRALLAEMHPEMLPAFKQRLQAALFPAPAPAKPRKSGQKGNAR